MVLQKECPGRERTQAKGQALFGLVSGHKHHKGLPDGQTLFVPAGTLCSDDFPHAPRYLSRTFDLHSSELSNTYGSFFIKYLL
jgi:hypothetical protein